MLTDLTIKQFLKRVASDEPVPGGGSVAALAAALSASLSEMVARLTLSKTDNTPLDEKMSVCIDRARRLQTGLIQDVDRDADAYAKVMKAYRMPKGSEQEQNIRRTAIQDALKEATSVPLSVAEMGVALLTLARTAATEGKAKAMTDALVAALMARSAVFGALYNVRINLASITDAAFKDEMMQKAASLEKEAVEIEQGILSFAASALMKQA